MRKIPRTQLAVMLALRDGRVHAYDIKLRLAPALGHSSVYAALARAEANGYVVAEWEPPDARPPGSGPRRKYFEMTDLGRSALAEAAVAAESVRATRSPRVPRPRTST